MTSAAHPSSQGDRAPARLQRDPRSYPSRMYRFLLSEVSMSIELLPGKDNILITDDGNVAVTDIAVYTEACRWLLFPGPGTIKIQRSFVYQAPEFINPGTNTFNPRTKPMDVFAVGSLILAVCPCILYPAFPCHKVPLQVLTDDSPYRRRSVTRMLSEIMVYGHSHILQSSSRIISGDILDLVRRCWARNPIDRPSIGEVVAGLVSF